MNTFPIQSFILVNKESRFNWFIVIAKTVKFQLINLENENQGKWKISCNSMASFLLWTWMHMSMFAFSISSKVTAKTVKFETFVLKNDGSRILIISLEFNFLSSFNNLDVHTKYCASKSNNYAANKNIKIPRLTEKLKVKDIDNVAGIFKNYQQRTTCFDTKTNNSEILNVSPCNLRSRYWGYGSTSFSPSWTKAAISRHTATW